MDPIEAGRQRADQLHLAAVADGADPRTPYAFALAEAGRRGIEVEAVAPGDVRLHGGRATYDPDAMLILHERTASAFDDAFLICHEIAHVELGGAGERDTAVEINPLRGVEDSPTAIDHIVDYGRRARREVQMDLFAREFLLPRSIARTLHLEQGATAADIAARLGAPVGVVAMQLLDALLLPTVAIAPAAAHAATTLNAEQQAAVSHRGAPYLLEAGPGTGKTQTLVARIGDLLATGCDPERILVLTFSNKAAGELSERIARRQPDAAASITIQTFHAFGLDLVRRFYDRLDLPPDPRLMERAEAIELLEHEFPRLDLVHYLNLWDPAFEIRDILAAISRANDEVVDAAGYHALGLAMRVRAQSEAEEEAAERAIEVATVFHAYEELKRARRCLDFGDLVSIPVRLCDEHADVRAHLAGRYEHVLVDEYQDVNRASVRLLQAISPDGRNLWVVGDAKQSIYRFRGASSFNMPRFASVDFPGAVRGRLRINYRSKSEIVDTSTVFASAGMIAASGADVTMEAQRGEVGIRPEYRSVGSADEEIAALAEAIGEMRTQGAAYRDQAVLCAGNDRLGRIATGLESLGIPVLHLGNLFERDEIRLLLSLLSLLADRRAGGLLCVGATTGHGMKLQDVAAILSHLQDDASEPMAWAAAPNAVPGISQAGATAAAGVAELLSGADASSRPWDVLACVLLDRTRMAADIAVATDVGSRARGIAIWQFMNFLQAQPAGAGPPVARLLARVRRLALLSDDRDLRQLPAAAQGIDAVRLMTMHGAKGLEFPVVHLPSLTGDSLPRSPNTVRGIPPPDGMVHGSDAPGKDEPKVAHVEEQECLFFVALSRARDRLLLYSPTRKSNDAARARSSFIDRLGGSISQRHVHPSIAIPAPASARPVDLAVDGPVVLSDIELGVFQACPRRYFYTYVIGTGGRRGETAFTRMHAAIQHVVDRVVAGDTAHAVEDAHLMLAEVWTSHGPGDHGYADHFLRIAKTLLAFLLSTRSGHERGDDIEVRLAVGGGLIVMRPDQILLDAAGVTIVHRIRTGHKSSKEADSLSASAFHIAATAHLPGCRVEIVHLGDGAATPLDMTPRVAGSRRTSLEGVLDDIRAGRFPPKPTRNCPRCPSFFICPSAPFGTLAKSFSR